MRARHSAPSAEELDGVVDSFRGKRVLVLADLVADEFLYGSVQRVSREAPVLILQYDTTDVRLGGGANAVHNIATLGGVPIPVGVLGGDEHGRRLRALLRERGISAAQVATDPAYVTPVKTRVLAGGIHAAKHDHFPNNFPLAHAQGPRQVKLFLWNLGDDIGHASHEENAD